MTNRVEKCKITMSYRVERVPMMKKVISVILSVLVVSTLFTGCLSSERNDSTVNMTASQDEIYLDRSQEESVYGVEVPDPQEEVILEEESSSLEPSSSLEASSSQETSQAQASQTSPSSQSASSQPDTPVDISTNSKQAAPGEVRSVWLSYLTLEPMIKNKSQSTFSSNIASAFKKVKEAGYNTVIVHVRPFGDALYPSDYFPWSYLLSGSEGHDPGYDPLQVMISAAKEQGLRFEAWINPYRIRTSSKPLCADNPAQDWLDEGSDAVVEYNGGIYYNPGSKQARELIVSGVKEIVQNYDVDAIHFDDYFYPTTDEAFDRTTYNNSGTGKSLANWRRENVNILVRQVYSAIKAIDSSVLFGISPAGSISNNYDVQYSDVATWLSNTGYVDYICPQIYYGFNNASYPFTATVNEWNNLIKVNGIDMYVGIAAYKLGAADQWAGDQGKNEWLQTQDILARMVDTARGFSKVTGVAMYSYDSLFGVESQQVSDENENLKDLFK